MSNRDSAGSLDSSRGKRGRVTGLGLAWYNRGKTERFGSIGKRERDMRLAW